MAKELPIKDQTHLKSCFSKFIFKFIHLNNLNDVKIGLFNEKNPTWY